MISTRDLRLLPDINGLKLLSQSLAMLDAIIEPDWEMRYYSFDAQWSVDSAMASMRNGSGDDYFILFNASGAILKGFAHESAMAPDRRSPPAVWPGVLDEVPEVFSEFLSEPAFSLDNTTFCIWRTHSDTSWQRGNIQFPDAKDPDGSAELLAILDGNPQTYREWAEEYYESSVALSAVRHIYEHRPLTEKVVELLNDELSLDDVAEDETQIGY